MTREQWRSLLKFWCRTLNISPMPRLIMVNADEIPNADATVTYDGSLRTKWLIRVRRGEHRDPDRIMAHELLHVKSGLMDPAYEDWIHDVSVALAELSKPLTAQSKP